ncbi:ABC transporter substrate-binding protein [Streptococcus sciuri]|uniref:Extracellular solute-binding protein n=1 Tax=Streptococcus sciuri TaxID=2973939 RepID=A0ABT2F784_9STRE|nr:extracellular solute-binding protein [Streptococcus sciuri]MCS4487886.1 extracellular solute-binding protein [Streptococcus sciuri]
MIRRRLYFVVLGLVLVIGLVVGYRWYQQRPIVLKLGIYADSSWAVPSSHTKVIDEAITRFEKKHPKVKVIYETGIRKKDYADWLAQKIVSGHEPDVFILPDDDFSRLASIDALKNLSSLSIGKKKVLYRFYTSALAAGRYNHQQYALPFESNPTILCVNTDILDKEGIAISPKGWDLTTFLSICKQLTHSDSPTQQVYALTGYDWQMALSAYGGQIVTANDHVTINTPQMKKALNYIHQLSELKVKEATDSDFDQGEVAFKPITLAQYRTYKPYPYRSAKYTTFSWTCLPLPAESSHIKASQLSVSLLAIGKKTRHAKLAGQLLGEFISDKTQQSLVKYSQGASVIKKIMLSKETRQIFQSKHLGSDVITSQTLDYILKHSQAKPMVKGYQNLLAKSDYLINKALQQQTVDNDLITIEKQLAND